MMLWKSIQGLSAAGAECPSAESSKRVSWEGGSGWTLEPLTWGVSRGWTSSCKWRGLTGWFMLGKLVVTFPPLPSFLLSSFLNNFLTGFWYSLSSLCTTATAATNNYHFLHTYYVQNLVNPRNSLSRERPRGVEITCPEYICRNGKKEDSKQNECLWLCSYLKYMLICRVFAISRVCTYWNLVFMKHLFWLGFPGGSGSKESPCNAGDLGFIPGSGRSP